MKLSRCRIAVLCCLLIAPMLLASCARRGAGEAETATQRAEYTGNRTDLWDEEKNPPYTGDAWVPPGGDEPEKPAEPEADEPEPTRVARTSRLAQTGDESLTVICLVALLAVAGAGAAFVAYRKRR